jgi:Stress responsive A/B Barrel Domain
VKSPRTWIALAVAAAIALPALAVAARSSSKAAPRLAHMVFFTLKDRGAESRAAFVASCQKYLTGHPGTISISIGEIAQDVKEPVSDREFDVALHLVFEDKDANAAYQKSPRHVEFVEKNKALFAKVRVFDSYLAPDVK